MLASRIAVSAQQVHSVGNDDHGMLSVFENCTLGGSTGVGTLEMHRWRRQQKRLGRVSQG